MICHSASCGQRAFLDSSGQQSYMPSGLSFNPEQSSINTSFHARASSTLPVLRHNSGSNYLHILWRNAPSFVHLRRGAIRSFVRLMTAEANLSITTVPKRRATTHGFTVQVVDVIL